MYIYVYMYTDTILHGNSLKTVPTLWNYNTSSDTIMGLVLVLQVNEHSIVLTLYLQKGSINGIA